jgi:hypothetical protein
MLCNLRTFDGEDFGCLSVLPSDWLYESLGRPSPNSCKCSEVLYQRCMVRNCNSNPNLLNACGYDDCFRAFPRGSISRHHAQQQTRSRPMAILVSFFRRRRPYRRPSPSFSFSGAGSSFTLLVLLCFSLRSSFDEPVFRRQRWLFLPSSLSSRS